MLSESTAFARPSKSGSILPTPKHTNNLRAAFNPTLRATCGIAALSKAHGKNQDIPILAKEAFTLKDGSLDLGKKLPLLNSRYKFIRKIEAGTFSQLLEVKDTFCPRKRRVAIKCMNATYTYVGIQENAQLHRLNNIYGSQHLPIVRRLSSFFFGRHFCVVLELLGKSLCHRLYPHQSRCSLSEIRKITHQLVTAFGFLSRNGLIHADLKPENVLFASPEADDCMVVKLADFGNAMSVHDTQVYYNDFELQSLSYRSPEVLLGLPFDCAVDMWSLGCMLIELYTGYAVFKCKSTADLFEQIIALLGPLPARIYGNAKFAPSYFTYPKNQLETSDDLLMTTKLKQNRFKMLSSRFAVDKPISDELKNFIEFIVLLLEYDPATRLKPYEAIFHPFLCPLTNLNFLVPPPNLAFGTYLQCANSSANSLGSFYAPSVWNSTFKQSPPGPAGCRESISSPSPPSKFILDPSGTKTEPDRPSKTSISIDDPHSKHRDLPYYLPVSPIICSSPLFNGAPPSPPALTIPQDEEKQLKSPTQSIMKEFTDLWSPRSRIKQDQERHQLSDSLSPKKRRSPSRSKGYQTHQLKRRRQINKM